MNWNTHMYSMNTLFWIHPKVKWLSDASFLNREKTCLPAQWIRTQDQPRLAKQKIALQLHHLLLGNAQGKYARQFFFNVCGQFQWLIKCKQLQNALVDLFVTQCIKIVIDWVWLDWSGKYLAILYDAQTLLALSLCFMTWSQIFSLSLSQYIDK